MISKEKRFTSIKKFFLAVVATITLIFGLEVSLGFLKKSYFPFTEFVFFTNLSTARWNFLLGEMSNLINEDESGTRYFKKFHDVYRDRNLESRLKQKGTKEGYQIDANSESDRPVIDRIDKAYYVKVNSEGFRSTYNFSTPKKRGVLRLFALGDSTSFGKGIADQEKRFPEIIQKHFAGRLEVFNFGIEGCTTLCASDILEKYQELKPDYILFQVSGNDMDQTIWKENVVGDVSSMEAKVAFLNFMTKSNILLALSYLFYGKSYTDLIKPIWPKVRAFYRPYIEKIFQIASKLQSKVIVLNLQLANGTYYGNHVESYCKKEKERCLMTIRSDFKKDRSIETELLLKVSKETKTAKEQLGKILPYSDHFLDIIHPNEKGHEYIAQKVIEGIRPFIEQDTKMTPK